MSPRECTRVLLAGFGKQGREHHLPALASLASEGVTLVGLVELAREQARDWLDVVDPNVLHTEWRERGYLVEADGARFVPQLPVYPTQTAAREALDVDAVIIATPPRSHEAMALQAIEAGLPVLLEKPAAPTPEAVARIDAAARRARVPVAIASPFVHALGADDLRGQWDDEPTRLHVTWRRRDGIPHASHFWDTSDAGVVPDLYPHMSRIAQALVPHTPHLLYHSGSGDRGRQRFGADRFAGDDTGTTTVRTREGLVVRYHAAWADDQPGEEELTASLLWDDGRRVDLPVIADSDPVSTSYRGGRPPLTYAQAMVAQERDFVEAVRDDRTPAVSIADAVADARLVRRALSTRETWVDYEQPGVLG
ncbi:Gfo/Idh/MocA family protein [Actinokineospora inagensis]|uniref:Gfo/Idh/MocA family protein n=1 Tax=Actinokineospora inagensis TaxID=103730 RepID=UPI000421CEAE|nr:Gfo/Idh/MocA family oxidoreductase [Actinokineospora inagensis]